MAVAVPTAAARGTAPARAWKAPTDLRAATPGQLVGAGYIDDWVAYLTNPLGARPTPITTLPSHASPADAQFDTVGERNAVGQVQGDGAGPQRR